MGGEHRGSHGMADTKPGLMASRAYGEHLQLLQTALGAATVLRVGWSLSVACAVHVCRKCLVRRCCLVTSPASDGPRLAQMTRWCLQVCQWEGRCCRLLLTTVCWGGMHGKFLLMSV